MGCYMVRGGDMPETFTWIHQTNINSDSEPNVSVVALGDGYEQRQEKGINTLMGSYPNLKFIGFDDKCRPNIAKQAEDFLRARKAVEAFYWTPFDTGIQALFICRSWSLNKNGSVWTLTASFKQVPR